MARVDRVGTGRGPRRWPGEWPGKASVRESAEIWFEIKDSKLVPKKVELTEKDHETGRALAKHWP